MKHYFVQHPEYSVFVAGTKINTEPLPLQDAQNLANALEANGYDYVAVKWEAN